MGVDAAEHVLRVQGWMEAGVTEEEKAELEELVVSWEIMFRPTYDEYEDGRAVGAEFCADELRVWVNSH